MAKPTEKQVQDFEKSHKSQYLSLVTANRLWLQLFSKIAGKPKDSKQYKAVLALGKNIAKNVGKWYGRQYLLEQKAKIPAAPKDIASYFLNPKKEADLIKVANSYLPQKDKLKGMGFVPLLIWGAIALITAFTATSIVDEMNTTAEEKADLMKQTQSTLKDLEIPPDQAAAIITNTQHQASAGGGGLFGNIGPLLLIVGGGLILMNKQKSNGSKKD